MQGYPGIAKRQRWACASRLSKTCCTICFGLLRILWQTESCLLADVFQLSWVDPTRKETPNPLLNVCLFLGFLDSSDQQLIAQSDQLAMYSNVLYVSNLRKLQVIVGVLRYFISWFCILSCLCCCWAFDDTILECLRGVWAFDVGLICCVNIH